MTLRPFKVVGQIIAARYDEEGRVIAELSVGEFALYAPEFDKLGERIEEMWPQVKERFEPDATKETSS